ncbi:hypothetical protein CO613_00875 [Lysobacteraceae bacterium NML07-0707]|nr:hypothetical protein CO613_00875 [Xanthomonadaceae bacterium NML07-0707]
MRQIFTSARLETVEGVAKLLEDAGIATRIRNGRSYKGGYSRGFSYRDAPSASQPSVWVVHPDDYANARQLLREAGLLEPGPQSLGSFVSGGYAATAEQPPAKKASTPARIRAGVLVGIAAVLLMSAFWQQQEKPAMTPTSRSAPQPAADTKIVEPATTYIVETPPALARTLAAHITAEHGLENVCLLRDGQPMPDENRETSHCDDSSDHIHIRNYRTDGSGSGEVEATWQRDGKPQHAHYRVRREGYDWQVLK